MKEGWIVKKLGDVCNIQGGSTPKRTEPLYWENGNYPWFTVDDIRGQGRIITETKQKVTKLAWDKLRKFPENTVMLCCTASLGEYAITKIPVTSNQQFNGLIIKDKDLLFPMYLFYYVSTLKPTLLGLSGKATIDFVSAEKIRNLSIPIPPLPEQFRIVEELDQLSNIIEKKRQQLSELDNLAQSIFYDMFGDPVTNEKGWEVYTLKSVTSKIGSGATPKGGNESYKDEGISLIRSLNVYNNSFKYKDLAHIDNEQAEALNNVAIECGDVLLNITGASVARCCIVPIDVLPARVNQHVSIIRGKNIINNNFLNYLLTSHAYQSLLIMLSKSNGATREALTKGQLEALKIILPPLSLQQLFAQKIEAIEKQKALIKQSIAETEELFNSRMDYYFN